VRLPGYDAWLEKPYVDAEPDHEEDREFVCKHCSQDVEGWAQWYGDEIVMTCPLCEQETVEYIDPDPYDRDYGPDPDEQRDLRRGF
jgi:hypothetical protein